MSDNPTPIAVRPCDKPAEAARLPLWAALLAFQAEVRVLKRNQRNEFTGSDYLDMAGLLEAVGAALTAAGLVLIQSPTLHVEADGRYSIEMATSIVHAESGGALTNTFRCPVRSPEAQAVGSAVSYARRYAAMALLGLASERDSLDDDGNAACGRRRDDGPGRQDGPRPEPGPRRSARPAPAAARRGREPQGPRETERPPASQGSGAERPTKDEWSAYGLLAAQWRGQKPTKQAVLGWAESWRRTRGVPAVTGSLLREGASLIKLGLNLPSDPPGSASALAEWHRIRASAHEAAGALADGSDPIPSDDEGAT